MRFESFEPRVLMAADPVLGSISTPGETDRYGFTLHCRHEVVFDALSASPGISWSLSNEDGKVVDSKGFSAMDGVSGNVNQPVMDLPEGIYELTVDGAGDATGNYGFRLISLNEATLVQLGEQVSGTLGLDPDTEDSEIHAYRFSVGPDQRLFFDATPDTAVTVAPTWRLLDSNGNSQFLDAFESNGPHVLAEGEYTLLIGRAIDVDGNYDYSFRVRAVQDQQFQYTTFGDPVSRTIEQQGQVHHYTLNVTGTKRVVFDALSASPGMSWTLSGSGTNSGNRLFSQSDGAALPSGSLMELGDGQYTLSVYGTGSYEFRLIDLASATLLANNVTQTGTFAAGSETRAYQFQGLAGQRYIFQSGATDAPLTWRLLDPNGMTVMPPSAMNGSLSRVIARTGLYTLLVEGPINGVADNDYSFTLIPDGTVELPTVASEEDIVVGQGVAAQIDIVTIEPTRYRFVLDQPRRIFMDSLTFNSYPTWSLEGPRGGLVYGENFDSTRVLDLEAGEYNLTVEGGASSHAFRLLDLAQATQTSIRRQHHRNDHANRWRPGVSVCGDGRPAPGRGSG